MPTTSETTIDELSVLRTTNAELTVKARDRKAKITEHEASITDLQAKLADAEGKITDMTIGAPLRALANSVSPVPEIWLAEFSKHYKLESKDGKLSVLTAAGEAVLDGKEPIEFTPAAMVRLLTTSDNDALAAFRHITRGSLSSGGGAPAGAGKGGTMYTNKPEAKPFAPSPHFGLR